MPLENMNGQNHRTIESLESSEAAKISDYVVTDASSIPESMTQDRDWLVALIPSDSDQGKPPIAPDGGRGWADESQPLFGFNTAYHAAIQLAGSSQVDTESGDRVALAYRFTADGPYTGIDVDDVFDMESNLVTSFVEKFDSEYVERSVSGHGLHCITEAEVPDSLDAKVPLSDDSDATVEVYDQDRYFVCTGDALTVPSISGSAQEEVDELLEQVTPSQPSQSSTPITDIGAQAAQEHRRDRSWGSSTPSARRVIHTAKQYDDQFERLFRGDTAGYPSQSEADMALATKLAFYCNGDLDLMDECFRRSALYDSRGQETPKWREVHSGSGQTYGERTLEKATRMNSERYSGTYLSP